MDLYEMKQVALVTGFKRKKLDRWYQQSILTPHKPSRRQGRNAGYSITNMVQILLTDQMCEAGITLRYAGAIAIVATKEYEEVEL